MGASSLSPGAAVVRNAVWNLTALNSSVVATSQLYGATYTLCALVLMEEGVEISSTTENDPSDEEVPVSAW